MGEVAGRKSHWKKVSRNAEPVGRVGLRRVEIGS